MAGVLSFALGIETSAFAAGIDRAGGRLLAFLSIGKLVSEAIEGVMGAIERGGALNDLSARTGESVENLYKLQEAFAVVGISVDSLPGMINKFNKSLSGVGEMGEKTDEAFTALGLSVADLKKMDAPGQMAAVAEKLALLDKGSAVDVASRLFGREGSANMMQLSRDAESFKETLAQAAKEAAVYARNAAAFDKLGDTVTRVKRSLSGMFAGIAEGIVPTLQGVADALNQIDLVAIGQDIGTMFAGAFQAFREGKLSILITDTIVFGFEAAAMMLPGIFAKLGIMLLRAIETPLIYLQSAMEWAAQFVMTGGKGQSFGDIFKERKAKGAEFFTEGNNLEAMNAETNQILKEKWAQLSESGKALFGSYAEFAARGPKAAAATAVSSAGSGIFKTSANALEKMGAIFGGGSAFDSNRQTASNTRTLVDLGRRQLTALSNLKNDKLTNTK